MPETGIRTRILKWNSSSVLLRMDLASKKHICLSVHSTIPHYGNAVDTKISIYPLACSRLATIDRLESWGDSCS